MVSVRDRLNMSQRWVLVLALGASLLTLGHLLERSSARGGWFGYAPNTSFTYGGFGALARHPWLDAGMWFGFVVLWALVSLWLLASSRES
jgi:hypothetical protein